MKKYIVDGTGISGIQLVEGEPPRILQHNEVLVEMRACSLNYRDLMVARGTYGSGPFNPFIPVSDMCGVVTAVGSAVSRLQVGDRVINSAFRYRPSTIVRQEWQKTFIGGAGIDGVLAEEVVYPEESLVLAPSYLSDVEASTLPIAGLTAWGSVVTQGRLQPGENVLIQGTGGVSLFSLQIAQSLHANSYVITTSERKAEFIERHFPRARVFLSTSRQWLDHIRDSTNGRGIDLVVDVVGGSLLADSLSICAPGARVQIVGGLSDFHSTLPLFELISRQIEMRGIFMESTPELERCARAFEAMKLKPYIDRIFPFEKAQDAYSYLESKCHIGKVVIGPSSK